jgi:6-phosphogluconolactonase
MADTITSWDERRDLALPGNEEETVAFAVEHWIHQAKRAIQQRGRFAVALSGGSTPKKIYERLAKLETEVEWDKVWLFWSDERAVPPDHEESNYRMAMESGLRHLPIPLSQVFRMKAEKTIDNHAQDYEELIRRHLGKHCFDLVMLGLGEDGHTASLFPNTPALDVNDRLVVPNSVPQLKTERMTLTYPCIDQSFHAVFYVLGSSKSAIVPTVLNAAILSAYPASRVGTVEHKALWIVDHAAGVKLKST